MMSWYKNTLDNMTTSVEERYREEAQEWTDYAWENSILVRTIQEQEYPFSEVYNDIEVQVDSVSDVTVNITKVIGDYLSIQFKDCSYQNYRGQKYLYEDNTYLCYDKTNPLARVSKSKILRCNNVLKWIDDDGKLIEEPIFLGNQISSTNDQIQSEGIIPNSRIIIIAQNNEFTEKIRLNKRFMFEGNDVFKIESIDRYSREDNTNDEVTMIKFYVKYDALLPSDNINLGLCDYYNNSDYVVTIDQEDMELEVLSKGKFTATVKLNNDIVSSQLKWTTSDENIITIDEYGSYEIVGTNGNTCVISCYVDGNESSIDSITITVVDDTLDEKFISITPSGITEIKKYQSIEFKCNVYIGTEKQSDIVTCTPNIVSHNYTLEDTIDGYKLTNNEEMDDILTLTFSSGIIEPIVMNIRLRGIL